MGTRTSRGPRRSGEANVNSRSECLNAVSGRRQRAHKTQRNLTSTPPRGRWRPTDTRDDRESNGRPDVSTCRNTTLGMLRRHLEFLSGLGRGSGSLVGAGIAFGLGCRRRGSSAVWGGGTTGEPTGRTRGDTTTNFYNIAQSNFNQSTPRPFGDKGPFDRG